MKTRSRITTLCLCLAAAALPASAAASEPVVVAPPALAGATSADFGTAGMNSGCRSRNGIEFREDSPAQYQVKHFFRHSCDAPVRRSECLARLFHDDGGSLEKISTISEVGRKNCEKASGFTSASYGLGDRFVERYSYKLTLKSGFVWGKPQGDYCSRTNERRTLVCSGNFETFAPNDKTVVNRPQ